MHLAKRVGNTPCVLIEVLVLIVVDARTCLPTEIRFVDFHDARNVDDTCESDDADRDQLELELAGLLSSALEDIALEVFWIKWRQLLMVVK